MTPLQQAYEDAIYLQNACNGHAILRTLVRHLPAIAEDCEGTEEQNTHPAIVLFLDKLTDLAGRPETSDVVDAMITAEKALAEGLEE